MLALLVAICRKEMSVTNGKMGGQIDHGMRAGYQISDITQMCWLTIEKQPATGNFDLSRPVEKVG